jgi:hypothetical protein
MFGAGGTFYYHRSSSRPPPAAAAHVNGAGTDAERAEGLGTSEYLHREATERTPLITRTGSIALDQANTSTGQPQRGWWWAWLLQALILIPIPVMLLAHTGIVLVSSISQIIPDGIGPGPGACISLDTGITFAKMSF